MCVSGSCSQLTLYLMFVVRGVCTTCLKLRLPFGSPIIRGVKMSLWAKSEKRLQRAPLWGQSHWEYDIRGVKAMYVRPLLISISVQWTCDKAVSWNLYAPARSINVRVDLSRNMLCVYPARWSINTKHWLPCCDWLPSQKQRWSRCSGTNSSKWFQSQCVILTKRLSRLFSDPQRALRSPYDSAAICDTQAFKWGRSSHSLSVNMKFQS